jgi:hypothetical protein
MTGPVTASWALSQTANDVVAVSKGVLAAATSDNVQALALLACESFGTTLAMSLESSAKVHQLCSQSQQSAVIRFMKAQIGYQKGDSGWQLSQSDSGLRFLGLTACLVTIDHWAAAEALRELITETAMDRKLIPTSQQLKQLIHALEYRLSKSGFPDSVLGWGIWLDKATQKTCIMVSPPSGKVVRELVKAASSLGRLGQTHKLYLKIPLSQAAWVIAFLKWCLGAPPSVMMGGNPPLLTQPDSSVFVNLVVESKHDDIEVRMVDEVGNITELVRELPDGLGGLKGMIEVRTYAQKLLQYIGPPDSTPYRACLEALPYGCGLALKNFQVVRESGKLVNWHRLDDNSIESPWSITIGGVFPDQDEVEKAMGLFLGLDVPSFKTLPDGLQIVDLPLLILAKKSICSACPCKSCLATTKIDKLRCKFELFMRTFSYCVATILLISLLVPDDPQGALLRYRSSAPDLFDNFTSAIYFCVSGNTGMCSLGAVVERVLHLVGHKAGEHGPGTWIMSSSHGQTVYPELLETLNVGKTGLLRLLCIPGRLYRKDVPYTLVENAGVNLYQSDDSDSSLEHDRNNEGASGVQEHTVQGPCDAYISTRTIWQISPRDNRLALSFCAPGLPEMPNRNPIDAIRAASGSYFVDCSHDRMAKLTRADTWLRLTSPGKPDHALVGESLVGIVQTDKNERMRFLALAAGKPCIVRCDACLECCIDVCRSKHLNFVIC